MSIFGKISEQIITNAMQKGEFDNLPGEGKPFIWEDFDLVPEDEKLAFDLLKKSGVNLPWIDQGKEIRNLIKEFRQSLRDWYGQFEVHETDTLVEIFQKRLDELNRKIFDYNNAVPLERLQFSPISVAGEVERAMREYPPSSQEQGIL